MEDCVDVFSVEEFVEVGVCFAAFVGAVLGFFGVFFEEDVFGEVSVAFVAVAYGDALNFLVADEISHVEGALAAYADEAHVDAVAGGWFVGCSECGDGDDGGAGGG